MPLPLRDHEGVALATLSIVWSAGLSVLGDKVGLLTDTPALYVHDTGGLLGGEKRLEMVPLDLAAAALHYSHDAGRVRGYAHWNGVRIAFEIHGPASALWQALPTSEEDAAFSTPMEVSVRGKFDEDSLSRRLQSYGIDSYHSWHQPYQIDGLTPATLVLVEHRVNAGEMHVRVTVRDGRLRLHKGREIVADLPADRLSVAEPPGNMLRIATSVTVADRATDGLEIGFPAATYAKALYEALGPRTGGATATAAASAHVIGKGFDGRADVVLGDNELSVAAHGGSATRAFTLSAPAFRIAGTSAAFILGDAKGGVLRVEPDSPQLRQSIQDDSHVREAALRTLESGPWPVMVDDQPALIGRAKKKGCLFLRGDAIDETLNAGDMSTSLTFPPEQAVLTIHTEDRQRVVVGERETLRAALGMIRTQSFAVGAADDEQLVHLLVGLEGRYLEYTLFGPILELHRVLLDQVGVKSMVDHLRAPDGRPAALALASVMASGTAEVRTHFNRVLYSLPAFLVDVDSELLGAEPPDRARRKRDMSRYRAILGSLRLLLSETHWTREMLLRIEAVQGNLRSADYTGAAISLVGAALVNPIFLLSGAQQTMAARAGKSAQRDAVDRTTMETVQRVMRQWDELIHVQLPGIAHQVMDGLFPLRWEMARDIAATLKAATGKAKTRLRERLVTRAVKLESYLMFPEGANAPVRNDVVEASETLRQALADAPFERF
ncbi:MAG: hypothetical protein ACYS0K_09280 [Planctomycetota bacterium]